MRASASPFVFSVNDELGSLSLRETEISKKTSKKLSFYGGLWQHMNQIPLKNQKFFVSFFQKRNSFFILQGFPMTIFSSTPMHIALAAPEKIRP